MPPAPAAPSTGPLGSDAAVLGAPMTMRRWKASGPAVAAQFIRPVTCVVCDRQFFPRALPKGLPRCGHPECA